MSIDPKNDRSCYYERIMNGFINVEGYCNIRGAAEKIVELEERNEQPVDCREAFEKWMLEQRATKVNMRPEGFYVVSGIQQQWQIWQHLWKPEREIVLAKNPTESNDGKSDEK